MLGFRAEFRNGFRRSRRILAATLLASLQENMLEGQPFSRFVLYLIVTIRPLRSTILMTVILKK